jgi:hypothetical protein
VNLEDATVVDQLDAFERLIRRNPVVTAILDQIAVIGLPDGWLAAGALF